MRQSAVPRVPRKRKAVCAEGARHGQTLHQIGAGAAAPGRGVTHPGPRTMHKTDVAIVGGGLAGSLAAAMLGRAGIDCTLIDPHEQYPNDFRCEKLDGPQVELLQKTGIAEPVLRAATFDRRNWVARYGVVVERRPGDQHGIFYTPLVNTVRAQIPERVPFIKAKARAIATS